MFFDSHCHLDKIDLEPYQQSFDHLIEQVKESQVNRMVCIGVDLESFADMHELIAPHEGVYATVGVHPDYENAAEPSCQQLVDLAALEKVVAIGETGLDYYHTEGPEWQRRRFRTHIQAALEVDKPLVIHTRMARKDTLGILHDMDAQRVGGVLHCFTEDWDMARQAIDLNFYISISGIVTFKQAENVRAMAQQIPDERLLIETDAPWLTPAPHRGKANQPGNVSLVAQKLAEIRNCSIEHIAQTTTANACQLFGVN